MPAVEKPKKKNGSRKSAGRGARAPAGARALSKVETPVRNEIARTIEARGKYVYCIIRVSEALRFGPLGIGADPADVRRLTSEISGQKGSTYFARMQYGRLVDAALQHLSEKYLSELFESLRDVAVASRANKPIGDKMIMNAAFLVSRDRETAFDQKVKEIGARFDKLTFKYTGPWPPYNFVNIRLKLERAKEK